MIKNKSPFERGARWKIRANNITLTKSDICALAYLVNFEEASEHELECSCDVDDMEGTVSRLQSNGFAVVILSSRRYRLKGAGGYRTHTIYDFQNRIYQREARKVLGGRSGFRSEKYYQRVVHFFYSDIDKRFKPENLMRGE